MNAMTSIRTGYALSEDEMFRVAPSIFATEAHSSRSDRFAPIPTIEVLRNLAKEGFQPFAVQQAKTRVEGKAPFTKHVVRLRSPNMPVVNGTALELLLVNGNDGSAAYKMALGAYRFVCANGMLSGTTYDDVKVRHTGRDVIGDVIEGTYSVVAGADRMLGQIEDWERTNVSRDEAMLLANAAHSLRYPEAHLPQDDEGYKMAPIEPVRLLSARRYADQAPTLWATYNRLQENTVRGGLKGLGQRAGRTVRATTREVKGIDQNLTLNRALWTLAEEFAKLKAAA